MEKCHLALWIAISHSVTLTTAPWFLWPNFSWSTGAESLDAKNLSMSKQATLQLLVKPGGDLKCGVSRLHDENANRISVVHDTKMEKNSTDEAHQHYFWQLVCWRRLLQRHDSKPLLSSLSVQCWTLVWFKEMKLLFNSVHFIFPCC